MLGRSARCRGNVERDDDATPLSSRVDDSIGVGDALEGKTSVDQRAKRALGCELGKLAWSSKTKRETTEQAEAPR